KGVTVEQVARVNRNFTEAGIMVHGYLMYGFPTQTAQETIDSLEMVRQMFEVGIMQSGFWHQFAMTAHSPVGLNPEAFDVINHSTTLGSFANNDMVHEDTSGANHDKFSFGLKKSLFNYMHGLCFDFPLQEWFEFKIPRTKIVSDYIVSVLENEPFPMYKATQKVVWLGSLPLVALFTKSKKGRTFEKARLVFHSKHDLLEVELDKEVGEWLLQFIKDLKQSSKGVISFGQMKQSFEEQTSQDFEPFIFSKQGEQLRDFGLLII